MERMYTTFASIHTSFGTLRIPSCRRDMSLQATHFLPILDLDAIKVFERQEGSVNDRFNKILGQLNLEFLENSNQFSTLFVQNEQQLIYENRARLLLCMRIKTGLIFRIAVNIVATKFTRMWCSMAMLDRDVKNTLLMIIEVDQEVGEGISIRMVEVVGFKHIRRIVLCGGSTCCSTESYVANSQNNPHRGQHCSCRVTYFQLQSMTLHTRVEMGESINE